MQGIPAPYVELKRDHLRKLLDGKEVALYTLAAPTVGGSP